MSENKEPEIDSQYRVESTREDGTIQVDYNFTQWSQIEKEMGIIAEYLIELKRDVKSQEVIALRTLESQTKFKKEVTSIVSKIKPPISKKSPTTAKKRSSKKRVPKTLKGK